MYYRLFLSKNQRINANCANYEEDKIKIFDGDYTTIDLSTKQTLLGGKVL